MDLFQRLFDQVKTHEVKIDVTARCVQREQGEDSEPDNESEDMTHYNLITKTRWSKELISNFVLSSVKVLQKHLN